MSRYVVRVIGPAGRETYLWRMSEVPSQHDAQHFRYPAHAMKRAEEYRAKVPSVVTRVMDTHDVEREVA